MRRLLVYFVGSVLVSWFIQKLEERGKDEISAGRGSSALLTVSVYVLQEQEPCKGIGSWDGKVEIRMGDLRVMDGGS